MLLEAAAAGLASCDSAKRSIIDCQYAYCNSIYSYNYCIGTAVVEARITVTDEECECIRISNCHDS